MDENAITRTARKLFEDRQLRSEYFSLGELFGEPAWDMLLFLFVNQGKGKGAKVEGLALASRTPVTHALRWLEQLKQKDVIFAHREEDGDDEVYLRLTSKGHLAMSQYLHRIALSEMG